MKKILFSLLAFPLIACANSSGFLDVQTDHQFKESIDYAQTQGIVSGYSDGTFKPNNTINRAEFTKIIIEAIYQDSDINTCELSSTPFSDVSSTDWFAKYICIAKNEGIINGYADGTFKPGKSISFVEAAKIIDIAFDGEEISSNPWYKPYVQNLSDFVVIPQTIQSLDKNITRGDMTEMIWRWMEEVTHKDFMGYENEQLTPLSSGDFVFGFEGSSQKDCENGETYDEEYKMCITNDDVETQNAINSNIGDFSSNPPTIGSHKENIATADAGIIIEYEIKDNILHKIAEGENLSNMDMQYKENTLLHKKIWNQFNSIIPNHSAKNRITNFVLFSGTGENEGTLAYVHQKDEDPSQWVLGVNTNENFEIDGTIRDQKDLYYTLIHEFTHVLSLNEDNTAEQRLCTTYIVETGCLNKTSPMGRLVEEFWKESRHWAAFETNPSDENGIGDRYDQTPERYVSEYAATNPGEDIAEVFTHFVLHPKPTGTDIKDKKILMLYEFPELVSLRNAIRTSLGNTSDTPLRKRNTKTPESSPRSMLLSLAAPSVHNEYYAPAFSEIINFQVAYINAINTAGNDTVRIFVDNDTAEYFAGKVDDKYIINSEMYDIWMRDPTTVNPYNPVQFVYTWASMTREESKEVQNRFNRFADTKNLSFQKTDLRLDGGNIVDNYAGRVITTTRFLEDNNLSKDEGIKILKELLDATEVAIVEPDEDVLAHADGMVAWLDDDVLAVNDYSSDSEFRTLVLDELKNAFPSTTIVEIPVGYKKNKPGEWEGFSSACGVNLNLVTTPTTLYIPIFGMDHEAEALEIIAKNTSKKIVPINASEVCGMGGSVRCLTWQVAGKNKEKILK